MQSMHAVSSVVQTTESVSDYNSNTIMISYVIILSGFLGLASTQPCPYNIAPGTHCSQICNPFQLGHANPPAPLTECYKFFLDDEDRQTNYMQVLIFPDTQKAFCPYKVLEIAIQAVDRDGFPIGQFEYVIGTKALGLVLPHCTITPERSQYIGIEPKPPIPLDSELPVVGVQNCVDTPSLKLLGRSEFPNYAHYIRNTSAPYPPIFVGTGLLWRHNEGAGTEFTFIAEFLLELPATGVTYIERSYMHYKDYFVYLPKPPPISTTARPALRICFGGNGPVNAFRAVAPTSAGYSKQILPNITYITEIDAIRFPKGATTPPPPTIPPVTIPPVTIPPVTILPATIPPVTILPATIPPVTIPPATIPPVTIPPVTIPPVTMMPPLTPMTMTTRRVPLKPRPATRPPTIAPPVVIQRRGSPPPLEPIRPAEPEAPPQQEVEKEKDIYTRCALTKKCLASNTEGGSSGAVQAGDLTENNDCIRNKRCFVMLSYGDAERDNGFDVDDANYVYIEMLGASNSWVALGLSQRDRRMGEDFVVECEYWSGVVNIHTSWNVGRQHDLVTGQPTNVRLNESIYGRENFVRLHQAGYVDQHIFCKFSLKKRLFFNDPRANNTQVTYDLVRNLDYVLMAVGDSNRDARLNLQTHAPTKAWITLSRVALGSRFSPTPFQQFLIHLHGQIMYIVFLFIYPTAIFISRYYKETFIRKTFFGLTDWHFVHIILQTVGLAAIFGGHFCLTFGNEGWSKPTETGELSNHFWTALTTGCIYFFNVFIGCVDQEMVVGSRCDICHWLHAIFGHSAYLLGLVTLAGADKVQYSDLPCNASYIVISYIVVYFLFHIFMSFHYCWIDWVVGVPGRVFNVGPLDLLVQPASAEVAPGKRIRIYVLGLFMLISGGYTIALVIIAGIAKKDTACFKTEYFIELNRG